MLTVDDSVKVLDFGLARRIDATQLTRQGAVMGTVSYMSPEQARGEQVDHRSDIWSLGVVLYEMLTGQLPFKGTDDQAVLYSIFNTEPEELTKVSSEVPDALSRTVRRAMAKEPDERYQQVTDLSRDLGSKSLSSSSTRVQGSSAARRFLRSPVALILLLLAIVAGAVFTRFLMDSGRSEPDRTMVAVMPFTSIGSEDDAYIAEGISDAILTRLSSIQELGVISRQSTQSLAEVQAGFLEVGQALGVEYVLHGTVQLSQPDTTAISIVVRPKLIRTADGVLTWSDTYDQPMSEMLQVQASIAETVARALDLQLLAAERAALAAIPTESLEAYDHWLKGESIRREQGIEAQTLAAQQYAKAVEIDPKFIEAWSLLARQEIRLFRNWGKEDGLQRADAAVARAVELDAHHVSTKMAQATVAYYGRNDFDQALEYYEQIQELQPSNTSNLMSMALIQRRQDKWNEAVSNLEMALELDPRNQVYMGILSNCYMLMRRFSEGLLWSDRSRSIDMPKGGAYYEHRALLLMGVDGSLERARIVMLEAADTISPEGWEDGWIGSRLKLIRTFSDVYEGVFAAMDPDKGGLRLRGESAVFRAELARATGQHDLARAWSDTIQAVFKRQARAAPESAFPALGLLIAYANLGLREQTIAQREVLVRLYPPTRDSFEGMGVLGHLAESSAKIGEFETALDDLEILLSAPSGFFVAQLEHDPLWDPLRDHPRFRDLLDTARSELSSTQM
jgi:TolB-like protein